MSASADLEGLLQEERRAVEVAQGTNQRASPAATHTWAKVALVSVLLVGVAGVALAFRFLGTSALPAPRLGQPPLTAGSSVLIVPAGRAQAQAESDEADGKSYTLVSAGTFCDPDFYSWSGDAQDCRERCSASSDCDYYSLYTSGWCQLVKAGGCDAPQAADDASAETYVKNAGRAGKARTAAFSLHSSGTFCDPDFYLWSGEDANCQARCAFFENCTYFTTYQANSWCQLVAEGGCSSAQVAEDRTAATFQKVPPPPPGAPSVGTDAQAKAKAAADAREKAYAEAKVKAAAAAAGGKAGEEGKPKVVGTQAAAGAHGKAESPAALPTKAAAGALKAGPKVQAEEKAHDEAKAKSQNEAEAKKEAKAEGGANSTAVEAATKASTAAKAKGPAEVGGENGTKVVGAKAADAAGGAKAASAGNAGGVAAKNETEASDVKAKAGGVAANNETEAAGVKAKAGGAAPKNGTEAAEAGAAAKNDTAEVKAKAKLEAKAAPAADAKRDAKAEEADEAKAKEAAAKKAKEEEEARAKAAAEAKAKAEADAKAKAAAEAKAKAEAEAKAKAEAEEEAKVRAAQLKAEAEAKAKAAAAAKAKAEAEAAAKAEAEAEAAAKAAAEAKAKAELEARIKAAELKAKAEAEAKARAKAAAKAKAEAEAEEEAAAEARLRAEFEAKMKAEAEARAKAAGEEDGEIEVEAVTTSLTATTTACSGFGEDCRSTHCCSLQGMQCYQKNEWWAACQGSCVKNSTEWSCKELGKRSQQKNLATWPGEDCSRTHLCASPKTKCFRKDVMTAYCATAPDPDWSGEVIGDHRWEYAIEAEADSNKVSAGDSLYCFMAVLRGSPEEALQQRAQELGASIFSTGCQAHAVFDSTPSDFIVEGSWQSFVNTDAFYWIWMKVREDGTYKNFEWTVKVDPDTVFMPDRLRGKLWTLRAPRDKPVYVKNCDIEFGFMGAIEIMNTMAVNSMLENLEDCKRTMGSHSGEDGFVKGCLDAVGAGYMTDVSILVNPKEESCLDTGRVAFHPHKEAQDWANCFLTASR